MTLVTVYVRSPISGYITGRNNYCNGGDPACNGSGVVHGTCRGWSNPVDIAGSGSLYLRVNYPNVRRVVTYVELRCCSTNYGSDYRRTVTVELYGLNNTGYCYIGAVMYGHVKGPAVSNGATYDLTSNGLLLLGTVPSGNPGGCFTGPHSHMERFGGSVVAPCCGGTVSTSTNIYKFTWDNAQVCD